MSDLPLSPHQADVLHRMIARESAHRTHIVVQLTGAHAYGFPSHDSDLDLKATHIAPLRALVGFSPKTPATNWIEWVDGVEVDYTSNEIGGVLLGIVRANGNYLERILGPFSFAHHPTFAALPALVKGVLSKHIIHHYLGFAESQLTWAARTRQVKKHLYVMRTALTGAHLMMTGELVQDVNQHLGPYGFEDVRELVARKQAGEKLELTEEEQERWLQRSKDAIAVLEGSKKRCCLPPVPSKRGIAALEDWLVALRVSEAQAQESLT